MFIVLLLSVLVVGVILARRNLRLGRGDRRGASRLAAFVFVAYVVAWFFGAHHVLNIDELGLFIEFLFRGLGFSCFLWVLYIALEPYVRRRWPATLVSWSRLLAGGFRDPLVGRDVLVGGLFAAFGAALTRLGWFVPSWLGQPPTPPYGGPQWQFLARTIIADTSLSLRPVLAIPLGLLFVLFLLRALLRKEWAATVAFILLFTVAFALGAGRQFVPFEVPDLIYWGLMVFLLIRFGLLAFVAQGFFSRLFWNYSLTIQGSAWYAGISLAGILLMAALAPSTPFLGGRPVFGGAVLED
jgi:hypothetical protein